uniref:Uncharacterized protein n=1 Tax=Boodleopsis sp. H.0758 TaxID=2320802 RepID=A0A386AZP9_9CHLO|nr:hypothetical protein [Boodleopsis sp. H.0758]AYC64924.1 hypothetical protein [Boodleopsis sp. H.0758]
MTNEKQIKIFSYFWNTNENALLKINETDYIITTPFLEPISFHVKSSPSHELSFLPFTLLVEFNRNFIRSFAQDVSFYRKKSSRTITVCYDRKATNLELIKPDYENSGLIIEPNTKYARKGINLKLIKPINYKNLAEKLIIIKDSDSNSDSNSDSDSDLNLDLNEICYVKDVKEKQTEQQSETSNRIYSVHIQEQPQIYKQDSYFYSWLNILIVLFSLIMLFLKNFFEDFYKKFS